MHPSVLNKVQIKTLSLVPMTSESQEVLDEYNINFHLTTSTEIYIYDTSSLADSSGNKLGGSNVVSYSDIYGNQIFQICLLDIKSKDLLNETTSPIAITLHGENSNGIMDSSTFKNSVVKALLMIKQTMETHKQMGSDYCQNYNLPLHYDAKTKTANLDTLATVLSDLTDIYSDRVVGAETCTDYVGELETYFMDLLDELL